MRQLLAMTICVMCLACGGSGDGPDLVQDQAETRLFAASTEGGHLHIVSVNAVGNASQVGPNLSQAVPAVERVGRLLQSPDGTRVMIQDNDARKTHVLRDAKWRDLCADIGVERCYATASDTTLTKFMLNRDYEDPAGFGGVVATYQGRSLAASDGRIAVHSDSGWTAFTDGALFLLSSDGEEVQEIPVLPGEVARQALGQYLMTFSNNYDDLWFRDPVSGGREPVRCPNGDLPKDIIGGALIERCQGGLHSVADGALVETGNRLSTKLGNATPIHVEPKIYSLVLRTDTDSRIAEVMVVAPDGDAITSEERRFDEVEEWTSIPKVSVRGLSAKPTHVAAYVTFELLGLAHDDVTLSEEHGILVWRLGGGSIEWHPLQAGSADSPVWFPATEDRAFWVTTDGRLMGFDYTAGQLADYSAGRLFHPGIYP